MTGQAEEPDIIQQGQGWSSRAVSRVSRTVLALPRRAAVAIVAGIATAVLIASSVVAIAQPWAGGAGLPDPCKLLPATTVASLVPMASGSAPAAFISPTTETGVCGWQDSSTLLSLDVENAANTSLAQREFSALADPSSPGSSLSGTIKSLPGIGDQAIEVLTIAPPGLMDVYLRVRSGSALFGIGYELISSGSGLLPSTASILARLTSAARSAVLRLTTAPRAKVTPVIIAAVPASGRDYASPASPCALLTRQTVTSYLHNPTHVDLASQADACGWVGANESVLILLADVERPGHGFSAAERAQQAFEGDLEASALSSSPDNPTSSSRQIHGLGTQTVVSYVASQRGSTAVELYTWLGNAAVGILFQYENPTTRPAALSVAIALTRDIFAALART